MNPWINFQTDTLKTYLHSAQIRALSQDTEMASQDQLIETIIEDTIEEIRLQLPHTLYKGASLEKNRLPAGLSKAVAHLVIEALQSRLPVIEMTSDQIRNAGSARQLILNLAKLDTVYQAQVDTRIEVVNKRKHVNTTHTLQGF